MLPSLQRLTAPNRVFSWTVVGVLLCVLFASVAVAVHQTERTNRRNLTEQFRMRTDIGEAFLRAYVRETLERERSLAELQPSATHVSDVDFNAVIMAYDFKAALILDSSGRLLNVHPYMPELRGTELAARYAHLQAALDSGSAVSGVVSSAVGNEAVVAFATRYESMSGPRVFSGAFDVRDTPLKAYVENLLEMNGATADLVDASGAIVASSRKLSSSTESLSKVDPALVQALAAGDGERYSERLIFERQVSGTPWRLVLSVEQSALFAQLGGHQHWLQWALFGAFCLATGLAAFFLLRLRAVSSVQAHLARVDRLTDLPNRLHLEENMARLVSAAVRHKKPFSIFIVDVDHFKSVNDTYGHRVGDEVLRVLAARMASALRAEDMLGRWGGEEFMALLPNTCAEGAAIVANRVRATAGTAPVTTSSNDVLHVTVSIGCATKVSMRDADFIQRADDALYNAKRQGRNRVVSSSPPPALHDHEAEPMAQST